MASLPEIDTSFANPIVKSGADPCVVDTGEEFAYCRVVNDAAVYIAKSGSLETIGQVELKRVWEPTPGHPCSESLWAPELHRLDGKWYIYVAGGRIAERDVNHRMYALEGIGDDPQVATYNLKAKVAVGTDQWAIDGTVLTMPNKDRFFVWSGRENYDDMEQHLYIAQMANPWTLIGEGVRISSPIHDWERRGGGINEGPFALSQGERRHLIFSASHSLTDHYCLGQLSLTGDNPLDPEHWVKWPQPIFKSHNGLIAPGHASFLQSPDQSWGWMVYHTARRPGAGWDRQVRLAAFILQEDGSLDFMPEPNRLQELQSAAKWRGLLSRILHRQPEA